MQDSARSSKFWDGCTALHGNPGYVSPAVTGKNRTETAHQAENASKAEQGPGLQGGVKFMS